MKRLASLLLLIALVGAWFLVDPCSTGEPERHPSDDVAPTSDRRDPTQRPATTAVGPRTETASSAATGTARPAPVLRSSAPSVSRDGAPAAPSNDTGPAGRQAGAPPPALPVSTARDGAEAQAGQITDKTGWNKDIAKQLNKEFMPLASECIVLAQGRDPALQGTLAVQMQIWPTEDGKAIVAAVTPRADNQIVDPELFECIRESSFSLEGLDAPHSFDITMPIGPSAPK
jgi:hypothetical protein